MITHGYFYNLDEISTEIKFLLLWCFFYHKIIISGRDKGRKVKGKAKFHSNRAGLQFPVGHIYRLLRKGNYAERGGVAAVLMGYLAAEVLELAGNVARDIDSFIIPRHEKELNKLLWRVTIAKVVFYSTFKLYFCQRRLKREPNCF
ncbi:unnamed protein product [Psylliodes chrysocephalus]|uniref:Histone H2A n=1 Tax=Psylliodes chrysocephalus TaxID=3402493 RepID=A0A9P0GFU4_9CUCU|nr:unnamed protein product [Psylliodes chrysocephala]